MAHKGLSAMCKKVQMYNKCVEALVGEGQAWWGKREKEMAKWDSSPHAKPMIW